MSKMAVSVIIPGYNVEKSLEKLIISLKNQTFEKFEVIFVDDGSVDNTREVFFSTVGGDNRFIYQFQENQGQGVARNRAVNMATGEWLCFVDADDDISNNYLEALYNKGIEDDADIVVAKSIEIEKDVQIHKVQSLDFDNILCTILSSFHTKLWKTSFYVRCDAPQPSMKFEDIAVVPFLVCLAEKISITDACVYYYCRDDDSTVGRLENYFDRRKALIFLCDLFKQRGLLETHYEKLIKYVWYRCKADTAMMERVLRNELMRTEGQLKDYFKNGFVEDNDILKTKKVFIIGSYSLYRSSKYIEGNDIIMRIMDTSIESMTGPMIPGVLDEKIERVNLLRQENVIHDLNKHFYRMNAGLCKNVSFILIDLLDERYDLGFKLGGVATISDAYNENPMIEFEKIISLRERMELYEKSLSLFIKKLQQIADGKPVILVKSYLSEYYGDGKKLIPFENQDEIKDINGLLHVCYEKVERLAKWITMVEITDADCFYTDIDFRHGCYPWHYNEDMYRVIGERVSALYEKM